MQLSDSKLRALSEITPDTSQVFFASMFVGPLLDKGEVDWLVTLSGLMLSFMLWIFSLSLAK